MVKSALVGSLRRVEGTGTKIFEMVGILPYWKQFLYHSRPLAFSLGCDLDGLEREENMLALC